MFNLQDKIITWILTGCLLIFPISVILFMLSLMIWIIKTMFKVY